MTTVTIPVLHVSVRRDANTITPVTVPEHELEILQANFGQENVTVGERAGAADLDPSQEHERLCAKYGHQAVIDAFGQNPARLTGIVEKASDSPPSAVRKNKSAD